MARPLVVVGEAVGAGAELELPALDQHHLRAVAVPVGGGRLDLHGLVALDHLEQLEHGLVVLVLVGDHQLVHEPVGEQRVIGGSRSTSSSTSSVRSRTSSR